MAGVTLTTVHGRGTHANRPAAAQANAGYRYLETDTFVEYQSDGTTWNLAALLGVYEPLVDPGGPTLVTGADGDPILSLRA